MATLTHKTTLLLAPEEYALLSQKAKDLHQTMGELIRRAIRKVYAPFSSPESATKAWTKLFRAKAPVSSWDEMEKEILKGRLS